MGGARDEERRAGDCEGGGNSGGGGSVEFESFARICFGIICPFLPTSVSSHPPTFRVFPLVAFVAFVTADLAEIAAGFVTPRGVRFDSETTRRQSLRTDPFRNIPNCAPSVVENDTEANDFFRFESSLSTMIPVLREQLTVSGSFLQG